MLSMLMFKIIVLKKSFLEFILELVILFNPFFEQLKNYF